MTLAGAAMLAAGIFMCWVGGPFGWTFGLIYAAAGLDCLWFEVQARRLRRRHTLTR
jgi:hypothetical protein